MTELALSPSRSQAAVNPWLVAAIVVIPTFMEVLDTTIAVVALRYIAGGLSATVDDGEWVITSYLAANAIILPITFAMIVVLLYGLFNSWRDSMLALLGLPFAISGGLAALYVSGLDFSISAAIGFISLMGVSVMSGILIINGYYRVATGGMAPLEAMSHAVQEQMRPILMMTLSACIGLLPAAISTGIGSQVQRPLATVIVGGMLIGPIMLLVVVPALQSLFLRAEAPTGEAPRGVPDAPPEGT